MAENESAQSASTQALDSFLQKTRTSTANIPNSVAGKGGRTEVSCLPVKLPHLSSLEKI